jgi:hypothetical protein
MEQIYTENQIIHLIYAEADLFERLEAEFAMEDNANLAKRYIQWSDTKSKLDKIRFAPSGFCLDKILAYSQLSLAVR